MRARLPISVALLWIAAGARAASPELLVTPASVPLHTVESGAPTGLDTVTWALGEVPTGSATLPAPLISEYVEGSGENKALEIYNGTGGPIDLGDYQVDEVYNGGTSSFTINLGPGTLPDGGTWVLVDGRSTDQTLLALADQTNNSLRFNGDDFVGLYDTVAGAYVDGIGQIDVDPGDFWGTEPLTTLDHTLRRRAGVCAGHDAVDGPFEAALALEWTSLPQDTFDDLGRHDTACPSVTVALSTDAPDEGTVQPGQLLFSTLDFDQPQTVRAVGVDDAVVDGDVAYHVLAEASGAQFDGLSVQLDAVNHDDDAPPGATVLADGPLRTAEDGTSARFEVRLDAPPGSAVSGTLESLDASEGYVSNATLVFTSADWYLPQAVTVSGVDDAIDDGDVAYQVALSWDSLDAAWAALPDTLVDLVNTDDDTAGASYPTTALDLPEGGTDSLEVVLDSQPVATVRIDVAADPAGAATPDPAQLVFTPTDWDTSQAITVHGADDAIDGPDHPFTLDLDASASDDPVYAGLALPSVAGTVRNDDHAGIEVGTTVLQTREGGAPVQYTVRLTSQPVAAVVIPIESSDPGEVTAAPATLVLDASDWQGAPVTVTPVDDAVVDGPQLVTLSQGPAGSTDPKYAGLAVPPVTVTNDDDDTAALVVTGPDSTEVPEGASTSFTVALGSQPTADVVVQVASSNPSRVQVAPGSLTFAPGSWHATKTVTVGIAEDTKVQGDEDATVTLHPSSTDPIYAALPNQQIDLVVEDDDLPPGHCGCATGGPSSTAWLLALAALVRRRRGAGTGLATRSGGRRP